MAPEQITVPDEIIVLVGRLVIENAMLQTRLAAATNTLKFADPEPAPWPEAAP